MTHRILIVVLLLIMVPAGTAQSQAGTDLGEAEVHAVPTIELIGPTEYHWSAFLGSVTIPVQWISTDVTTVRIELRNDSVFGQTVLDTLIAEVPAESVEWEWQFHCQVPLGPYYYFRVVDTENPEVYGESIRFYLDCEGSVHESHYYRNLDVEISQNPVHKRFIVTWDGMETRGEAEVTLYDAMGNVVAQTTVSPGSGRAEIELGDIPSGTYWVVVDAGEVGGIIPAVVTE